MLQTREASRPARHRQRVGEPRSSARRLRRLLALLLTTSSATVAQTGVDADLVHRATVGSSTRATPGAAVSGARRAPFEFPTSMRVLWRARVTGPVTLEPIVDHAGRIVILHERGSLSMLNETGKARWSLRLGDATPGTSPALLSDGTLAIYNFDNRLLRIDPNGKLVGSTPLALKGKPGALLPLERGGVALAVEDHLVRLDHRGEIIARAEADHAIVELLSSRTGVLVVDKQGQVYRFHATGKLSLQGSFGSNVVSVALAGNKLFAVSGQKLLSFDLASRTARMIYATAPNKTLQPWLALGPKTAYVAVSDGTLRGLSYAGRDRLRLVLGDSDPSRPSTALLPSATTPALADAGERVMLANAGSETIIVDADGSHHTIANSACLSSTSLTPLSRQRVLLVCRNGELLALSAAPSRASASPPEPSPTAPSPNPEPSPSPSTERSEPPPPTPTPPADASR